MHHSCLLRSVEGTLLLVSLYKTVTSHLASELGLSYYEGMNMQEGPGRGIQEGCEILIFFLRKVFSLFSAFWLWLLQRFVMILFLWRISEVERDFDVVNSFGFSAKKRTIIPLFK